MPKRLTIDQDLDNEIRRWVRSTVRMEMARAGVSYRDLANLLIDAGAEENERNIANKVARGELSASVFLLCLKVMGCETLSLREWSLTDLEKGLDDTHAIDDALNTEMITVQERDDESGVYRFRIGKLKTAVTVILVRRTAKGVYYTVSHLLVLPGHKMVQPVSLFAESPALSLRQVIRRMTKPYQEGVQEGLEPLESWLVPFNSLPRFGYDSVGRLIKP